MKADQSKTELREAMLKATMARRGCDREEAEVIMQRIASRLDGYSHDEVRQMHPLPEGREELPDPPRRPLPWERES